MYSLDNDTCVGVQSAGVSSGLHGGNFCTADARRKIASEFCEIDRAKLHAITDKNGSINLQTLVL